MLTSSILHAKILLMLLRRLSYSKGTLDCMPSINLVPRPFQPRKALGTRLTKYALYESVSY